MNRAILRSRALRRAALCLSTVLASGLAAPALAQTAAAPETFRNNDELGVDLVTGSYNPVLVEGDIGSAGEGIRLVRYWGRSGFRDNWSGELAVTGSAGSATATVVFGNISEKFTESGAGWVNVKANGATLTSSASGSGTDYTFKAGDGTAVQYQSLGSLIGFDPQSLTQPCAGYSVPNCALPTSITDPDGAGYTLTWDVPHQCFPTSTNTGPYLQNEIPLDSETQYACTASYRLVDVRSKSSYALKLKYEEQDWNGGDPAWYRRTGAKLYDLSQVYCEAAAVNCDGVAAAASVSYAVSGSTTTVTNERGEEWKMTTDSNGRLGGIRRPGATSDTTSVTYDTNGRVTSITESGETKTYTWTVATNTTVATSTGGGETATVVSTPAAAQPTSVTNGTSNATTYAYDSAGRVTRETRPEGDYTEFTYDARGNVTETRLVAKTGPGTTDIVTTANYDTACTNAATCNQPNYAIDALSNRTDYTYDSTHGGVTRVQLPAPVTSGTRPQVDYAYTALYPQVRDASNALVNAASPEYKVTQITACATAATCAGTAGETKVTLAYNTPNLLVSAVTAASGDGALSATTAYTYDAADNLKTADGPLPGSDDTVTLFYDTANRRRGTIGPDPDGSGTRERAAERLTYDAESRVSRRERGSATAATDAALDAMTVADFVDYSYDAKGNLIQTALKAGSTTYAVSQTSYDTDNRPLCNVVRMNPAVYASLPSDACTASTYSATYGPDRIAKNFYDASGRITKVQTALGQIEQADEVTVAYTANGQTSSVKDAEANLTTYEYDGHDRLRKTRYPSSTQGANASSTTDYEELTYDARSSVTQRRLRDGLTIGYDWDALGRLKDKNSPGTEADTAYTWDLLGRLKTAVRGGQTVEFKFDALGRLKEQIDVHGTVKGSFDAAGRRTALEYPGGDLTVNYDYDLLGLVTAIRENGATSGGGVLALYAYDSLGRRNSVTFGNGSVQSFVYDAASRLETLTSDLGGSANPNDLAQSFIRNPAGQIASQTRTGDVYAFTGKYNVNRGYEVNGLNQLTQSGSVTLGYDARGNLTQSGSDTYTYDSENRLTGGPNSAGLAYDPLGRLYQATGSGTNLTYLHDGDHILAQYNQVTTTIRRFVYGPGADAPIVFYRSDGTLASGRRFMMADERGSIISNTDTGAQSATINAYDEYGVPKTSIGTHGYTGQVWLGSLGMWYYKARVYSPTLGRFMQTDPIGYGDGMNWYNYVGGDPVNFADPTGMCETTIDGVTYTWHFANGSASCDASNANLGAAISAYLGGGILVVGSGGPLGGFGGAGFSGGSVSYGSSLFGGDGGSSGGDPCAAKETPTRTETKLFEVSPIKLAAVAQAKFLQHSWSLTPDLRPQSTFGGVIGSGADLATAAGWIILTHDFVPSGGINVRATANLGHITGSDVVHGNHMTTFLTVILGPVIGKGRGGLPERLPVSMYPGC